MAETSYLYNITADTANSLLNSDKLSVEITESAIAQTLSRIDTVGNTVAIYFENALSAGDVTILTGLVNSHDGASPEYIIATLSGTSRNPVVTDDSSKNIQVFSRWINTTNDTEFVCVDNSVGAAVWVRTSGHLAGEISYDNGSSGLLASDVQDAIDELSTAIDSVEGGDGYSSAAELPFSPDGDISATNTQAAIVEVRDDVDTKLALKANTSHDTTHILGGSDEIDGDQLDIDFTPSNYTPDTSPGEVSDVNHLSAHLSGIDEAFGNVDSALATIPTTASDLDFVPDGDIAASNIQSAIEEVRDDTDTKLALRAAVDHDASHISGGSDEIDGDQIDIDYSPSNYTPTTLPAQVSSTSHLTAHLAGIDDVLADIGAGGGGGSGDGYITVQDNGVEVSTQITNINFGSGLQVNDDGSGAVTIHNVKEFIIKKRSGLSNTAGNWLDYLTLTIDEPGVYDLEISFGWTHSSITTEFFEARVLKDGLPVGSLPKTLNDEFPILQASPTGAAENNQVFFHSFIAYVTEGGSDFVLQFKSSGFSEEAYIWNGSLSASYIEELDILDQTAVSDRMLRLRADSGFFNYGTETLWWKDVVSGRFVQEDGAGLFGCTVNPTGWSADIPTFTYTGSGSGFHTPSGTYTSASTSHTILGILDQANISSTAQNVFEANGVVGGLARASTGTDSLGWADAGGFKTFANGTAQTGKQALLWVFNAANTTVSVYRNGSLVDSAVYSPAVMGGEFGIGNYHNGGFPLSAGTELAEVVVWNKALTSGEMNNIWSYISRYGL